MKLGVFLLLLIVAVCRADLNSCLHDWNCDLDECCMLDRRALWGQTCQPRVNLFPEVKKRGGSLPLITKRGGSLPLDPCVRYRSCDLNNDVSGCSQYEICISTEDGFKGEGICVTDTL